MGINPFKKKNNKNQLNDTALLSKIPYICGYEQEGIIESVQGKFSKMYYISDIKVDDVSSFDSGIANQKIEQLLNSFPENMECQFVVHNKLIEQKNYLSKILIKPDWKGEKMKPFIESYDNVIVDNIDIGHNNVKKDIYFIVSVSSDTVDDAIAVFKRVDDKIRKSFSEVYGITATPMSLIDRLHVMYTMFNPGKDDFTQKLDPRGRGEASIANLKSLKMTTKDAIAPKSWDTRTSLLNYSVLNGGTDREQYARAFFINSLPGMISSSMISDLTNISSSMVFSTIYEPIDTKVGFDTSAALVAKNTVITTQSKRDTVAERKRREKVTIETAKVNSETEYFNKQALHTFKTATASDDKVMKCTFTVILYSGDLESLDRDSELLRISASKFAASVKCLDLLQLQGFQTCLPLCSSRVDVTRVMDIQRLAAISPVNIQDVSRKNGVFVGLNAINDNLIMLNRKNNINLNGFIAGTEHSGKTYQNKREIFNALISTNDRINIITSTDEYDDFVTMLGGNIVTKAWMDPFEMVKNYGLLKDDSILKSYFLEAFVNALHKTSMDADDDEIEKKESDIEAEVNNIVRHIKDNKVSDTDAILTHIIDSQGEYPYIEDALGRMGENYDMGCEIEDRSCSGLTVYKVKTASELLLALDYLWNRTIEDKKKNLTNWIFVDPIDTALKNYAVSEYLSEYMSNASMFQTILTFVIQDSVHLFNAPMTSLMLEDIVSNSGYAKLLNLGPIERRRYVELLNIPNALISYVSNVEPGKGIVITSASNIAFDDNFLEEDDPFRKLFMKDIKQIKYV